MEHLVLNFLNDSFQHDYPVEKCTITVILFGSMLPNFIGSLKRLKWPIPFLINMFSALKGSQFY